MDSRERLMRTLQGKKIDRVPISLHEFDGFYDSWIYDYPEYVEILDYAKGKTDKMYFWAPVENRPVLFYGSVCDEDIRRISWEEEGSEYVRTVIDTPKGTVFSLVRQDEGIHTSWTIEPLCKDEQDARKILALPYEPWRPSIDSFFELDRRLSCAGVILGSVPDALCLTVQLFGLERFLKLYMKRKQLILELMDFFHERIKNYLEHVLHRGAVTLYRIVGPEYATPPFLHPSQFDRLVTSYDIELVDLLHNHKGYARLHSHGKVRRVLEAIRELGVDAVDPLEPPPDGDVELRDARKILGSEIVLVGNIEERLLEIGDPHEIERHVEKAMSEGSSDGGFILCPTAMPLTTPLRKQVKDNIIHYIDCGLKYGKSR